MKLLKRILIALATVIAIALIAAWFAKKDYIVKQEVVINRPKQVVFEYIKYLKNQDNYSKWAKLDPDMKKNYTGIDGTVGFISAWDSAKDDVGTGEQEIKHITEGERIDYELRFKRPFESTQKTYMATEAISDNQTKVKWGFEGSMPYPTNLMLVFMDFEQLIGQDLQTGLDNLKTLLEQPPQ